MQASPTNFDFSGYATKANVECTDGRIIDPNAFSHNDGDVVPVVWQHQHSDPGSILGNAFLQHREDGTYAFVKLNDATNSGQNAKQAVLHGDITFMSIYANSLVERGKKVLHGQIRELSLVISGANPGAKIDNLAFAHGDGSGYTVDETEAIITSGDPIVLFHAEEEPASNAEEEPLSVEEAGGELEHADDKRTLTDIYNTLNEDQRNLFHYMIAEAVDGVSESLSQSAIKGETEEMKVNMFADSTEGTTKGGSLSHDDMQTILKAARRDGSLKHAAEDFLAHAASGTITNIDYLFPEANTITPLPQMYSRQTAWVSDVFGAAHKSPFSRIKTVIADVTADEARAKGYVTGEQKVDEVLALLKRTTIPTTVYKKQTLDRDDVIDITDIDIVAWIKMEMRFMLEEEIARAILVGDGRSPASPDKINPAAIRPIYGDDTLYAYETRVAQAGTTSDLIDAVVAARSDYLGSGNPVFFATPGVVSNMLLLKDTTGRRLYSNMTDLAAALRVSKVVEVPIMDNLIEEITPGVLGAQLMGIAVNMNDYYLGADKGGSINMFDDFDIDFNQLKYLIETRCSGALVRPKSAIILTQEVDISG